MTSKNNVFKDFNYATKGGIFYLIGTYLDDSFSTYTDNSALYGGVIYCQNCSYTSTSNQFNSNRAYIGGVIYATEEANITSTFDLYYTNSADEQAGVAFISQSSFFNFQNNDYEENEANIASVLSALYTSQTNPFTILKCIVINNKSLKNTISLQYSNGLITDSFFKNNIASEQS